MKKFILPGLILSLFTSCSIFSKSTVKYEVTGTSSSILVSYYDPDLDTEVTEQNVTALPWTRTFSVLHEQMQLTAINDSGGTITSSIYVNGALKDTDTCSNTACWAIANVMP